MWLCSRCGRSSPDWAVYCTQCGSALRPSRPSAEPEPQDREVEHIAYVLQELPKWLQRGWISRAAAGDLTREYAKRRASLLSAHIGAAVEGSPSAPDVSAPAPQPEPVRDWHAEREAELAKTRAASTAATGSHRPLKESHAPVPDQPQADGHGAPPGAASLPPPSPPRPAVVPPRPVPTPPPVVAAAAAAGPVLFEPTAVVRTPPAPPRGPGLADLVWEFLRAHWGWHWLLAILAAALIVSGVRQFIQWKWVSAVAIALVPVLPMGIGGGFYYLADRARDQRSSGVYLARTLAILLAACTFFAINKLWLGGAVREPYALLCCVAPAVLLAAWIVATTRDANYLHLLLPGAALAVFAAVRLVVPIPASNMPPAESYGAAFLGLALVQAAAAWRARRSEVGGALAAESVVPLLAWAHLSATFALSLVVLPMVLTQAAPTGPVWAILAAGAVLYALSAQWFASGNLAWVAGGLTAGATGVLLWQQRATDWYAAGYGAVLLCVAALGMAAANRRLVPCPAGGPPMVGASAAQSPAAAYGQMALVLAVAAGAALAARIAQAVGTTTAPLTGPDWVQGAALGGILGALYLAMAAAQRTSQAQWAGIAAGGFGAVLAAHCLLPRVGLLAPHTFALDLLPFATAALFAGIGLHEMHEDAAWSRPWLYTALGALACGVAVSGAAGITGGSTPGVWTALLPCGALLATGAAAVQRDERGVVAWAWASATVASAMVCVAVLAISHTPAPPWSPALAAGLALAVLAWVWYGAALVAARAGGEGTWVEPLYAGAVASAMVGTLLGACGAHGAFAGMAATFAVALGALVTIAAVERMEWLGYAAGLPLLLGTCRLFAEAFVGNAAGPTAAIALALAGAAGFGWVAWRTQRATVLGMSVAALALAGMCGFAPGSLATPLGRYAAELSALGLGLGAVGLLVGAGWSRQGVFSVAAGVFAITGYVRQASVLVHLDPAWAGLAILPVLGVLVVAARWLPRDDEATFCLPLQAVALTAAWAGILISAVTALAGGATAYAAATTLLCYAPLFGASALAERRGAPVLGAMSAAVLVGGWAFALAVPGGSHQADVVRVLAVLGSALCAGLHGRLSHIVGSPHFGYAAGVAAVGAGIAFVASVAPSLAAWWPLMLLPYLAVLYGACLVLCGERDNLVTGPVRECAEGAACLAAAAAASQGLLLGSSPTAACLALLSYAVLLAAAPLPARASALRQGAVSAVLLAGAWVLFVVLRQPHHLLLVKVSLAGSSIACALLYAWLAGIVGTPGFGYVAGSAAVGAAVAGLAAAAPHQAAWWPLALLPYLAGMFALGARRRGDDEGPVSGPLRDCAVGAAVLACAASVVLGLSHHAGLWVAATTLLCYAPALAAAGAARSTEAPRVGVLSGLALAGGWALMLAVPAADARLQLVQGLAIAASAACAVLLVRAAVGAREVVLGYIAGLSFVAAGVGALLLAVPHSLAWWPAALLPYLGALFAAGYRWRSGPGASAATPVRHVTTAASGIALGWLSVYGYSLPGHAAWLVTGTLCAYAAAYIAATALRRTPEWATLSAATVTLAYGYRLGTLGWTPPQWGLGFACAGLVWLAVARAIERGDWEPAPDRSGGPTLLAAPVYAASAAVAAIGAAVALVNVTMPNQGMFTLLALAVAGTIGLGLFLLDRGEAFAHAGAVCYLLAYGLYVYDHFRVGAGVMDLYLIPLGAYMLVLGHVAASRQKSDNAVVLWWLGLLTMLTPTFVAFYAHYVGGGTPLHAALLLVECIVAVAWGIAQRIKAFVFSGSLFALAFAVVLGVGTVREIWSGVFAVAIGLGLAGFVFYVSTHQDEIREWMARASAEWSQWR